MTTAEFKTSVEAVVNQHGFTGSLIPAAWFDAKREDERYGLLYDGGNLDWNVEQIANTLHAVAHQGKMLVAANRDGLGEEFAAGKQCLVTVEGEGMRSLLYRVHGALRQYQGETNNFELVAYEKDGNAYLWAASKPGENYDAWQKHLGQFLRAQGLIPIFSSTQVKVFDGKLKSEVA